MIAAGCFLLIFAALVDVALDYLLASFVADNGSASSDHTLSTISVSFPFLDCHIRSCLTVPFPFRLLEKDHDPGLNCAAVSWRPRPSLRFWPYVLFSHSRNVATYRISVGSKSLKRAGSAQASGSPQLCMRGR